MESVMDPSAMAGMEDDPRAMGQMMKKMGKEMGEELPPEFDDVVDRTRSGSIAGRNRIRFAGPRIGCGRWRGSITTPVKFIR